MRLYDDKRAILRVGDFIEFTLKDGSDKIKARIVGLNKFPNFDELYAFYDKKRLGYEEDEIAKPEDMLLFYEKEKVEALGVLAIEIKLV